MCSCLSGGDPPGGGSASSGKIGGAFEIRPAGSSSRDTAAEGGASFVLAGFRGGGNVSSAKQRLAVSSPEGSVPGAFGSPAWNTVRPDFVSAGRTAPYPVDEQISPARFCMRIPWLSGHEKIAAPFGKQQWHGQYPIE